MALLLSMVFLPISVFRHISSMLGPGVFPPDMTAPWT